MDENLYGSLCLTDIPKELITTGKNGKKYLNIVVNKRREVSQFGMTHYVKAHCKKEQQREGVNYYIGELKPSSYQNNNAPGTQGASTNEDDCHSNARRYAHDKQPAAARCY